MPRRRRSSSEATRYYQIYDANTGRLLVQSPALEPLGLHFTPAEVQRFATRPRLHDIQTDYGRLRLSNSVIVAGARRGVSAAGRRLAASRWTRALERFLRLLLWSVPAGLLVAVVAGRWMAGRALAPLARLAAATRAIDVANLQQRLPVRGVGDELDEVAQRVQRDAGAARAARSARCGSSAPRSRTSCARRWRRCAARSSWR